MAIGRRSMIPALFSALLVSVLVAGPVAADTELGHSGATGFHALRDTMSKPGAKCTYKRIDPSPGGFAYEGKLKLIEVRPPKVRAISGSQRVGWRFFVQRQRYWFGGPVDPWKTTYRSPLQTRTTNASTNARFGWMSANVRVPSSWADDEPNYRYRVLVKMFWYHADGSVQGKATHEVDWYREILRDWPTGSSPHVDTIFDYCEAWSAWEM